MTRVVLNLCGVKSKGGITVLKNYLSQNKDKTFYVLYDNLDFEQYIKNFDTEFVDIKRRYHPILNLILQKDIIKKINTFDYVIHFGNFGFKTKIKSYTLIQNILPLVKPYSSVRNILLNSSKKHEIVDDMKNAVGYGGLIHNFKNYVIRGTSKYEVRVKNQYTQLLKDIKR